MASKALAIKYRPEIWDDVVEQDSAKIILQQQLESGEVKHAYLFCGGAGTGKTTCARIFAKEINKGEGHPIEMDAASNSGVDDVRNIIQQAKTKSLDSEYKVFIIDECHSISNTGWQAFLKLIEEPPAKSIFIFCTTDPQKIPKTILSRVQRYDFQRISQDGIVARLHLILYHEDIYDDSNALNATLPSLEYIAKIADGGMRDAISLMDKCLAYSKDLTLENVVAALGTTDYDTMFNLLDTLLNKNSNGAIGIIEDIYNSGKDLKQFVNQFIRFLLDIAKWGLGCEWKYIQIPRLEDYEKWLKAASDDEFVSVQMWLSTFINLQSDIKWSQSVKYDVEARILLECNYYEE